MDKNNFSTGSGVQENKKSRIRTIAAVLLVVGIFVCGYTWLLAPWLLNWGTTAEEAVRVLPGDTYVSGPTRVGMTQAITIDTPPDKIWPWLVQMGQDRAGFYSYEKLERLFGFGIHNTYRIVPEWQNLEAGDFVKFHQWGIGMQVVSVEKDKNILMVTDSRTPMKDTPGKKELRLPLPEGMYIVWDWDFNLISLPDKKTRLVIRALAGWSDMNPVISWILQFAVGFPSSIMQMQMLKELKQCSEGTHPALAVNK
ncbi:MAG: hypothetical protein NT072_12615 [Deltaproteobacteria bacterium]|nr:hypothetical protein [Deltaproteobacteria bacterium]